MASRRWRRSRFRTRRASRRAAAPPRRPLVPAACIGGLRPPSPARLSRRVLPQVSFDFLCTLTALGLRALPGLRDRVGTLAPIVAALPAAVLAAVLSHPGDTLLTEFYKGEGGTPHRRA